MMLTPEEAELVQSIRKGDQYNARLIADNLAYENTPRDRVEIVLKFDVRDIGEINSMDELLDETDECSEWECYITVYSGNDLPAFYTADSLTGGIYEK